MNKFEGLPSWRMISLKECADRRQIMKDQFERYGIQDYHFYLSTRYDQFKSPLTIQYHHEQAKAHHGTTIAHLENMRQWYLTTNEPYAIFSDDDVDLSYSDHWNFKWMDFLNALPDDWGCVQLIRLMNIVSDKELRDDPYDATLKIFWGRWWGVCALMKRSYVRTCLERHVRGPFEYDLRIDQDGDEWRRNPNCVSYAENVLYLDNGIIYNFPLFGELSNQSTIDGLEAKRKHDFKQFNYAVFRNLWKTHGAGMDLNLALTPPLGNRSENECPYGVTENIIPSEGMDSGSTPDKDANGDIA